MVSSLVRRIAPFLFSFSMSLEFGLHGDIPCFTVYYFLLTYLWILSVNALLPSDQEMDWLKKVKTNGIVILGSNRYHLSHHSIDMTTQTPTTFRSPD